jgi:hypothetical protein
MRDMMRAATPQALWRDRLLSKRYCNSSLPLVWSNEPLYDWRKQNDRY